MQHLKNVKGKLLKYLSSFAILFCFTLNSSAQGPDIAYTPLLDACGTGGVTLTATITDTDGVPTTGAGLPVLYYRIGSSSYIPITATYSGADTYTFTGVGVGAFTGAIIFYYIAAQDNLGNVSVSPSAGAGNFTANPPAAGDHPTDPSFYVIKSLLAAGTYTISPTGDFPTITDAVNAYNNSCLNGHVVFSIERAMMTDMMNPETLPITIDYNPQSSASRTLTIKPGLNSVQILQTANDGVFRLNGAQYVTIDGSVNGTASRNFKIINNSTTGNSVGVWITSSTTRPAQNITIKNMIFNSGGAYNGFGGIVVSAPHSRTEPVLFPSNNIQLINNALNGVRYGILVNGAATNDQNLKIYKNWVGTNVNVNTSTAFNLSASTELLGYRGISVSNQNNLTIDSNYVHGVVSRETISTDIFPAAGIALDGHISNANITRNQIFNIKNVVNPPELKAVYGIAVNPTNNNNNIRIYNNMISRIITVAAPGLPNVALSVHGIAIMGGTAHRIVYNSIQITGAIHTSAVSSCLFISEYAATTNTIAELKNNILSNRSTNGQRYSIYAGDAAINVISSINYNNYYSAGFIGYIAGSSRATLGLWQSATSQDVNSVNTNPTFISSNDLRVNGNSAMNEIGSPVAYVTKDFEGDDRDLIKPDIGADEVVPPPCDPGSIAGGTVTVNSNMVCFTNAPSLFASGYSQGFGITYQWMMSTDNVTFNPIPGQTNPATATSPNISVTTYYRLAVTCSGTTVYSNNTLTVNVYSPAIVGSSNNVSRCGIGTVSLNATPSTGASVRWYNVPTSGAILATTNAYTTPTLSSNATFYVEAAQGGVTGQVGPATPTAHGGTIGKGITSYKVFFDVNFPTKLLSVDIFPYGSGEVSTLTIRNADGTIIASIPYVTTVSGGATAQTIPINVTIPVGTGYHLWTNTYEDLPVSGLARNTTGSTYPYPAAATSPIQITGSEMLPQNYVYYYRWRYSTACESSRVPVNVTLTTPPAITATATPPSVCAGAPTTLQVTSPNPNYIYRWNPGNRPGASIVVNPTAHTTYIVTANDGVCANSDTIDVSMNAMPETVFAPNDEVKCLEGPAIPLSVTGGVIRGEPVLFENFNSTDDPSTGWVISTNGSTGTIGGFKKRPNGYNPEGFILESNDKSQFYLSDVQYAATHTSLRSPRLNFSTFVNVNFTFYHHYRAFMSDTVYVEISTVPGVPATSHAQATIDAEWTTIASYHTYMQGGPRNFKRVELDLSPWAGNPSVYIRFRMKNIIPNEQGYYWAIDNVYISGDDLAPSYTWSPVNGLFEDAAATIPYTGAPISTVYAQPDLTTEYIAASTGPNGCSARDTTVIQLYPVGGVLSGDNVICVGGSANLTVTLTGTAPWEITYTDGVSTFTETGILTSPHTVNVSPTANTTYSLVEVGDANCAPNSHNVSGTATIGLTSFGISSWLGNSSDWFDQNNWCGIVPDIATDVIIPSGTPFNPEIDGSAAAKNITINVNSSLWIFAGSSISISGNVVLEGTLVNDGEVILEGGATQSLADGNGTILSMNALTIDKGSGSVTIKKKLSITEELKLLNGTINLEDTITMRSTLTRTARIDKIGSGVVINYGQGRFITERYFPEHPKAWQLIAASTFGQTLNESWQENAATPLENNVPGYGTIMTSNLPNALVAGFDIYTPLGGTVTTFNSTTNTWNGVSSTSEAVSIPSGYMIYVRGDRSVQDGVTPATEVTLRSTGRIYSPQNPPASVSLLANKFTSVGNPYASAIDFNMLRAASSGVDQKFYVWDHELYGTSNNGGWQTLSNSNGWRPVPGGTTNYPTGVPVTTLQNGQAFLLFSSTGGTVNLNENLKIDEDRMVFRNNGVYPANLSAQLYNSGGLADGNVIVLDEDYSNEVDTDDAKKFIAGGHQFGIINRDIRLSVEARKMFLSTDTVYYDMRNLGSGSYRIKFTPENMPAAQAWIVDTYLQTETFVDLQNPSTYSFTVNSAAGSRVANRFHIIFVRSRALPVTITRLQAVTTAPGISVQWNVTNEMNIDRYEVMHSSDGLNFVPVGEVAANGGARGYSFLHTQPVDHINYYRLRIHENDGTFSYSEIVTAMWQSAQTPAIVIAPNPVVQQQGFTVSMQHIPAGKYVLTLYNASAQVVHSQTTEISNVQNSVQVYPRKLSAGIYYLIITGDGMREKRVLLVK